MIVVTLPTAQPEPQQAQDHAGLPSSVGGKEESSAFPQPGGRDPGMPGSTTTAKGDRERADVQERAVADSPKRPPAKPEPARLFVDRRLATLPVCRAPAGQSVEQMAKTKRTF